MWTGLRWRAHGGMRVRWVMDLAGVGLLLLQRPTPYTTLTKLLGTVPTLHYAPTCHYNTVVHYLAYLLSMGSM